ncbi:helix-turn-helix domain-containing protein [Algoriphagus machipongonensis]|nr:helix-turn-helix domain-containing protein [Algoriphagus machipongonensis]
MHNLVLSPIDPEILIRRIADQVTENILKAVRSDHSPSSDLEKLLTVQEASEFLSLKVPTIYSKVSRGELPVMKRSKRLYFSQKELLEYLKEGSKRTYSDLQNQADIYLKNNGEI